MNYLYPGAEATSQAAELLEKHQPIYEMARHVTLSAELGADVYVRYEFLNPVRSFKLRGALYLVSVLAERGDVARLVTVSSGNHGSAMAYAAQLVGMPITVGVPVNCNPTKVALIERYGAEIEFVGADFDETKATVEARELEEGVVYVLDGDSAEIVAGTATMGLEITQALPDVDVVIVPVGNGALIGGIGAAIKRYNSAIQVIGVQSEAAPSMTLSFNSDKIINTETADTFAGGMSVRVSLPGAVDLMRTVVDEMVLVSESELKHAMAFYYQHGAHLPEGAGAASLAAARRLRDRLVSKKVCLIATGGNVEPEVLEEIELGRAG